MFRSLKTVGVLCLAALSVSMLVESVALADFVLVSDYTNNAVYKYSTSGDYLGVFTDTHVTNPLGIAQDSSGNVYVSSFVASGSISKFTSDGTYVGLPAALNRPLGIGFGPDGLLYVSNYGASQTLRLDSSGNIDATFAAIGGSQQHDVAFKTNANGSFDLFATSGYFVNRYNINGTTITPLASTTGGMFEGIAWGPDGKLYVSFGGGAVASASVGNGSSAIPFAGFCDVPGVSGNTDLGSLLWVNGNLWCADFANARVATFNSAGVFQGYLAAPTGGFANPFAVELITTVPEPSVLVLLGTALVGLLAYAWRKRI